MTLSQPGIRSFLMGGGAIALFCILVVEVMVLSASLPIRTSIFSAFTWPIATLLLLSSLAVVLWMLNEQRRQNQHLHQQIQHLHLSLESQVKTRTLELQGSMAKVAELSGLQDILLYAISHDLRTTVIGSLMVLNTLQDQTGEIIPVSRILLQQMAKSCNIQLDRLNTLLDTYGNLLEGVKLHREAIALHTLVEQAIQTVRPVNAEVNSGSAHAPAELINQVPHHLPLLLVDSDKLTQVFAQALSNAIKHNPPGVEVRVEAVTAGNLIRCRIVDNGRGIPADTLEQIFDLKLKQQSGCRTPLIHLGLCLCKQIITAHGGEMGIHSVPEVGTQVWFTLPIER
ncbi:MAG: ATP-binding protein [Oculatellaceae cyanobacterium Prado106]|nr:ATP-binding protein [Oculatellaceae cyanobacterium Prado106]